MQILKKPSVLYKEHDGRWGSGLTYMYKNQIKQKSYTLSLSLSHTHTHTQTHTHTHTHSHTPCTHQIEQGWVRVIQAEETRLHSRLECSDCCSISNVWWQWVPDRRAKMTAGMVTCHLLFIVSLLTGHGINRLFPTSLHSDRSVLNMSNNWTDKIKTTKEDKVEKVKFYFRNRQWTDRNA